MKRQISAVSSSDVEKNFTITLTFGEVAENHVGMQKVGNLSAEGFNLSEILQAKEKFEQEGCGCDMIRLNDFLPPKLSKEESIEEAHVLIMKTVLKLC